MQDNDIAPFPIRGSNVGVCVADGYGIKIRVDRRHLQVEDGFGSHRRVRRFHKATTNLQRLVVIGHTGYITLEAIRWLTDAKITYVHLDKDGALLATTNHRGVDNAKLRRAQALALTNPTGLDITRTILRYKLDGQARVAALLPNPNQAVLGIEAATTKLESAGQLDRMLQAEAVAGGAYWNAWTNVSIRFTASDSNRIPDHWRRFGTRSSPITSSSRKAANPINALLNYLYALLEAEARIAATYVGLDPSIGILHADQLNRDSLALDIMEAVRPEVDAYLLDLLNSHVFRARDFHETRQGVCRILPPLTHSLAETTLHWAEAVAPIAEETALLLAHTPGLNVKNLPTPLTESNRSTGRDGIRKRTPAKIAKPPKPDQICVECGNKISDKHKRCSACNARFQSHRAEELHQQNLETLAQRRDKGEDPAHGGEAATKRAESMTRQNRASAQWDQHNSRPDPEIFRREILPGLATATLKQMTDATGLSAGYCSMIRRGDKIPHPRHWEPLHDLINDTEGS